MIIFTITRQQHNNRRDEGSGDARVISLKMFLFNEREWSSMGMGVDRGQWEFGILVLAHALYSNLTISIYILLHLHAHINCCGSYGVII